MKLATLIIVFTTALTAFAQKSPTAYDVCTQDESGAPTLKVNTQTGAYIFDDCDGIHLAGVGRVSQYPSSIVFQFQNGDFKGLFTFIPWNRTTSGSVRNRATGQVERLTDHNYGKRACGCS